MPTGSRRRQPQVLFEDAPWLGYEGRWGSSVVAPALQEWFARAEHPVSRTWLDQVPPVLAPRLFWQLHLHNLRRLCGTRARSTPSRAPGWTRWRLIWLLT